MENYLNKDLYSRFGLKLSLEKVQNGFRKTIKNLAFNNLRPIIYPEKYQKSEELWNIQSKILGEICRQLFLDINDFDGEYISGEGNKSGLGQLIEKICDHSSLSFEEFLLQLQICLNVIADQGLAIKGDFDFFIDNVVKYFDDYPILSVNLKTYKKKSPQIFPTTSKIFTRQLEDSLNLLDSKEEYSEIMNHYENGLKEFLLAKGKNELKDVVEDMYTACDLTVAECFNNSKLGFRHLFQNGRTAQMKINKWQEIIFNNLRDWMDKIKHGAENNYSKEDIETIILLASSFIRTLLHNASTETNQPKVLEMS